MGLLVSFVSPLSHENRVHARRRLKGGYANPAEPAIGRAPGTPSSCAEGDASRDAGRGRLAVWAAFAGINASICCHQRRDDILTTIRLGYSNAGIEAFNNKIKVTIRMAHGFRDTDNLIAMIKLRCSGLPIHLPTPIL